MSKKKDTEELSETEKINQRVDAMLDPRLPDPPAPKNDGVPPLDIFKNIQTAPELGGKLAGKTKDDSPTDTPKPQPAPAPKPKPKPQPSPVPAAVPPANDPETRDLPADPLEDPGTDKAVTDIAAKEGDTLLDLQDALGHKATRVAGRLAEHDRQTARRRRWAWFLFLVIFVFLVLLALPLNSYTCRWPVAIRLSVTTDILPSVCK